MHTKMHIPLTSRLSLMQCLSTRMYPQPSTLLATFSRVPSLTALQWSMKAMSFCANCTRKSTSSYFDHLHAVAFQDMSLNLSACRDSFWPGLIGHTILGSKANILSIKCDDLSNYIRTNYTTDHMVLMGAGGIDHNELVTFPPSPSLQSNFHWLSHPPMIQLHWFEGLHLRQWYSVCTHWNCR